MLLNPIRFIFLQTPKEVWMIQQADHRVRRIYLNQPHSANLKPTWYGESVGHYENAWVTFGKPVSLERIAQLLSDSAKAPFIRFLPGAAGDGLSSVASVKDRDRALVGRLRADARDKSGRTVCLTVVGDNLRLGAATNAVRIATRWFKSSDPELQA